MIHKHNSGDLKVGDHVLIIRMPSFVKKIGASTTTVLEFKPSSFCTPCQTITPTVRIEGPFNVHGLIFDTAGVCPCHLMKIDGNEEQFRREERARKRNSRKPVTEKIS